MNSRSRAHTLFQTHEHDIPYDDMVSRAYTGTWEGAGGGDSVASANVTFLSSHDLRPRPLARPGQPQLADR